MIPQPLKLLICAMGGEGGGVLTDWIVAAATAEGLAVQSTSVPGVAQRTGATTYYVEIYPVPGVRPIFALAPGTGDVDMVLATELMEAARAAIRGYATADRTAVIASTHRVHAVAEKMEMGDGRYDSDQLMAAVTASSRLRVLFDMERAAKDSGAVVNAVLLGALAGGDLLPIPPARFEAAIRAGGKAVESNLRGFGLGLAAAGGVLPATTTQDHKRPQPGAPPPTDDLAALPEPARAMAAEGVKRLIAYQDRRYARLYLDRLAAIAGAETLAGGDGSLTRAVARLLAVRMSFEDVIRVAALKTDPARLARIRAEIGAAPGQPVLVKDFLKPGIEEICGLLPGLLARPILAAARRRGWTETVYWGREVASTGILGFGLLWLMARLRPWRRLSHRFAEEQGEITVWLDWVGRATAISPLLGREVAECARLVKGYGETWRRGAGNLRRIAETVIIPALAGPWPAGFAIDAVGSSRAAALADPEGGSLDRSLAEIAALQASAEGFQPTT